MNVTVAFEAMFAGVAGLATGTAAALLLNAQPHDCETPHVLHVNVGGSAAILEPRKLGRFGPPADRQPELRFGRVQPDNIKPSP